MKLHPEDPRLTSYVLGELGPEEAAEVEQAIAEDPTLQAEVAGIRGARKFLTERLAVSGDKLAPSQRENIRRNARASSRRSGTSSLFQAWLIPASAAAVLALATFILMRMPGESKSNAAAKPTPASKLPSPPTANTATEKPTPEPKILSSARRISVSPKEYPSLELPVSSDKSNLDTVSKSILADNKLPPRESVRLEEILNNFPLRLSGTASIARSAANPWHPDSRESGMSTHTATLSTELITCPWKPSSTLLLVSVRTSTLKDSDLNISFHANPETVFRYRLLGSTTPDGTIPGKLPTKLAAGSFVNLAIEIEPSGTAGNLGSLEWSADGVKAPSIILSHNKDAEPSDDARFGALVCTFSQWLAGDQLGLIDVEVVAALARESASADLPKERAELIILIDKSLHLPGVETGLPTPRR